MSLQPTDVNVLTTLLRTHIVGRFPTSRHHAYMCSAGSQGYHALKEMLQSGVTGNNLLIESGDLRDVGAVDDADANDEHGDVDGGDAHEHASCCLLYTAASKPSYHQHLPTAVGHVIIYTNMTVLPADLLVKCKGLKTIDLTPLSQVSVIGRSFLAGCTSLKTIDMSPLENVAVIQGSFLEGCTDLTSVNWRSHEYANDDDEGSTPIFCISQVGAYFMNGCTSLTSVDLSPFSHLRNIESYFINGCTGLTSIDVSPFSQVTHVGWSFLHGCTSLSTINLRPLSQVQWIQGKFLTGCSSLATIDLRPLTGLSTLPEEILVVNNNAKNCGSEGGSRQMMLLPPHLEERRK